jgi:EmrB/QacA subfamily drug resistance transporter
VNRTIPLILAVALFMEMMDSTVIATSLPVIAADIGAEPVALKLALTSYLVALAIFIPISGWLSDRFGARNVFRAAILVFIVGSVACAFSNSLPSFVASRFLQGMGGSMMTPVGRVLLLRSTPRKDLVSAMAWLTVPALTGPMLGPPLGGFITTYFSWQWIFFINIPIGVAGIVLASKYLPRLNFRNRRRVDLKGFLLAALSVSGLVFGLSVISLPALPPIFGVGTALMGVIAGFLYVCHAREIDNPILDLGVLKDRAFRTSTIGGSLFRLGMGASPFLIPLMLQIGYGLNPLQTGLITFAAAAGAIAMKFGASWLYKRYGFKNVLAGAVLVSCTMIAISGFLSPLTQMWLFIGVLFVGGFTRSMFFTGANAYGYSSISDEDAGQASALGAVSQQISFALGVALAGSLLEASSFVRGQELQVVDFQFALIMVALVAAAAAIPFMRLSSSAGSNVSGHKD